MTRGFPLLEPNSVIFFMFLIAVAASTSNSSESSDRYRPGGNATLQKTATKPKNLGLMRRLVELKSDKDVTGQFLKNRHLYFKPRRKPDTVFSMRRDTANRVADSSDAANPPHSSFLASRNRAIISRGLLRTKRNSGHFAELFGPPAIPGESRNMEDLRRARTELSKIYHIATSSLLQITPDGKIQGVPDLTKYGVMVVKSVGYLFELKMTVIKIYGNTTKRYIAMRASGKLYTTMDPHNSETNFLHKYAANNYDAFLSKNHRRYITMSGANAHAAPARARKLAGPGRVARKVQFLNLRLKENEENALVSMSDNMPDTTGISKEKASPDTTGGNSEKTSSDVTAVEQTTLSKVTLPSTDERPSVASPATARQSKPCRKRRKKEKGEKRRKKKRRKCGKKERKRRKGGKRKSRKRGKTRTARSASGSSENIPDSASSTNETLVLHSILQASEVT